jgi:hypothetical protein
MSDTPFLSILEELRKKDSSTYLWTPLTLLYAQHRALREFHRDYLKARSVEGYDEPFFESVFVKNKYVLDYNSFINSLNQLARALKKIDVDMHIPNLAWIRFYRNVVIEHWDDYVLSSGSGSFSVIYRGSSGYPKVNVFTERGDNERKALRDQIDELLRTQGHELKVVGHGQDLWRDSANVATLYGTLELNFPTFNSRDEPLKTLTKLLFKFGLPGPIDSIDDYAIDLVAQLRDQLIQKGRLS